MSRPETPTPDPYLEPEPGFGVDGLPLPQQPREAVTSAIHSAACIPCRERGRDTAVEWQGALNEQAIRDMGQHLNEHDPWVAGVLVSINGDVWTFDLDRER